MRVAVNTRFLLSGKLEGIGLYTREVVRRWVTDHPECEFIFLFDRPFEAEYLYGENVRPLVVPPPARHPILWYLWFEWGLPRILAREKVDLFFSPDGYCSLRTRVPTLMVTHDLAYRHYPEQVSRVTRAYYEYYVPRFHRRADGITTVSRATREDVAKSFGIPAEEIQVAGNGVRPHFHPLSSETIQAIRQQYAKGQPYFFYVGAIHPRKNVHRLIQAFDQFRAASESQVQLLIAGRFAWQTGPVRAAVEASPFRTDIHFLGYLEEEELARLMGASLALTYVSLFEGFGVPLLEAMYAEVPILTSNVSSLPEVAGEAGLCVDPISVQAIAQGMMSLFQEEATRKRLVEAGRRQRQQYNWDATAEKLWHQMLNLRQ